MAASCQLQIAAPPGTKKRYQDLAIKRSVKEGKPYSYLDLLREAIMRYLEEKENEKEEE